MIGTAINRAVLERARVSRDARFDGRFFVGVRTTGIYCRPICPVHLPRPENVIFFPSAAAAQQGGFRPCLRCRPEVAPGSPAWRGTSVAVSRALRLIGEGALDGGSTEDLAERLGISDRHLRRLFQQHLGASPAAVAQTRRVHFAKQLLDETGLSMTEIAFSAGFGSLRRFNSAMRGLYGRPPSQLRKLRPEPPGEPVPAGLTLQLPYREPFDWDAMLEFFAMRAIPGVERVDAAARAYSRTIEVDGAGGTIRVQRSPESGQLRLQVEHPKMTAIHSIVERVRNLLDLFADPGEINSHLAKSPILAKLVGRFPGLRLPGCWDPFEMTIRAILGQQISVAAATTLAGRIVDRFGTRFSDRNGLTHLFPGPRMLAEVDCQNVGLTTARAASIKALAKAVASNQVDFGAEPEIVRRQLLAVPGIGRWTVEYLAMRVLGDPDAFPETDLGLIKAIVRVAPEAGADLPALAERWRPWRAYATMHLWHSSSHAEG